jgi:hypothetical protein
MLRVPFSTERLFFDDDPNYVTWLGVLVDRVSTTQRAQNRKAEKDKGSSGRR